MNIGARLSALALAAVLLPATSTATPFVFNLTCILDDDGCTPSGSWGTVTFRQSGINGQQVDVSVLLASSTHKLHSLYLNTNQEFGDYYTDSLVGVRESFNAAKAGDYRAGYFDLVIPESRGGSIGAFGSWTETLIWDRGPSCPGGGCTALFTSYFNAATTDSAFHLAVNLRNIDGRSSIWVADGPTVVPEPGSLMLLCTGIAGLGAAARRRLRRR